MPDNYCSGTVSPTLPVTAVTNLARAVLMDWGFSLDFNLEKESVYLSFDDSLAPDVSVTQELLDIYASDPLMSDAFVAGAAPHWSVILQSVLRLPECDTITHIAVEAAEWCSRMAQGEFGGWAYCITREKIQSGSTGDMIDDMLSDKWGRK